MPKNKQIVTVFVLVGLLICTLPGCSRKPPKRVVNEPLTEDEMAVPAGRYQDGVDMSHTNQVLLDSPSVEPILSWHIEPEVSITYLTDVLVDGEGGVWYPDGDPNWESTNRIIRLNPDGSMDWEKKLLPPGSLFVLPAVSPVVALKNAVVCSVVRVNLGLQAKNETEQGDTQFTGNAFLECIDVEGNTRWQTEPVEINFNYEVMAWHAPEDRIIMLISKTTYNIYSLRDGEFLQSFDVPGWTTCTDQGPIPIESNGWILNGYYGTDKFDSLPTISRVNSEGTVLWLHEIANSSYTCGITLLDDSVLLRGSGGAGITAFNALDGSKLWEAFSYMARVCGVTVDGNFIVSVIDGPTDRGSTRILDPEGNEIWSIDVMLRGEKDIIIYQDGRILIGYDWGISLLEPDGSIRWTVNLQDLGQSGNDYFCSWSLNPTPNGGLIALGRDSSDYYNAVIFYLESGE